MHYKFLPCKDQLLPATFSVPYRVCTLRRSNEFTSFLQSTSLGFASSRRGTQHSRMEGRRWGVLRIPQELPQEFCPDSASPRQEWVLTQCCEPGAEA